ncbi:hypothetical protein BDF19DRAFT_425211 [Syncephalis fuscata]|nr:hypothetical protein BDF19DRAFT_425211 [Syncephalis fuscata]
MLLSGTLLNTVYAHSCFEAIVSGRTQPPLTLNAFRAYLRICGAGEAELLQFWEWHQMYKERFDSLPPMVRSRARRPSELQLELHQRLPSSTQPPANHHHTPSVASSSSPILESVHLNEISVIKHPVPAVTVTHASGTPMITPATTMACLGVTMYDKRDGVEILPSILETAPLTMGHDLNDLGITSDASNNHLAKNNSIELTASTHPLQSFEWPGVEKLALEPREMITLTANNDAAAAIAMRVVATAGEIPASIPLQSIDSQTSMTTDASMDDASSITPTTFTRGRVDTGHTTQSNRPKKRRPPLQQEVSLVMQRWFPDTSAHHSLSVADETIQPESIEPSSSTPRRPAKLFGHSPFEHKSNLQHHEEQTELELPDPNTSITSSADMSSLSLVEQGLDHDGHDTGPSCTLPLPNTPAIRLALSELHRMAAHTTHPDIFLPMVAAAKNRLADYHLPRFVASLVRNVSHRTAHIRMFLAAVTCLLCVIGIFICLLFHANPYLRLIPLLIMIQSICFVLFSHFGLCLYRLYCQYRRDKATSHLQDDTTNEPPNQSDQCRPSIISMHRHFSATQQQWRQQQQQQQQQQLYSCDNTFDDIHCVYSTQKRLCVRLLALCLLLSAALISIGMLLPNIPKND